MKLNIKPKQSPSDGHLPATNQRESNLDCFALLQGKQSLQVELDTRLITLSEAIK